jgi:ABC-type iron transport system FetAB ATPase subunit
MIVANDQLDAQIFNTFITILYMYMFRAISCPSPGGQSVLIKHLVSSLSVSDDTRCFINTI